MACARPCDSDVAGPKAAWTNYRIFWEVGFLPGILKVYLAGIGETDDFRLLARRLQQEGGEVRRVQRNANRADHLAGCVAIEPLQGKTPLAIESIEDRYCRSPRGVTQ